MSRALIIIGAPDTRARAIDWCQRLPPGTRVEFKKPRRTLPQNDRFWAMLTDVATQLPWHGANLTPTEWKYVFLDALKRETRTVPSIDGTGLVDIGRSSSDLGKEEMTDLLELVGMFGANHGVVFHDPVTQ